MQKSNVFWILAFTLGFLFAFAVVLVPPGLGLFLFFNVAIGAVWFLGKKNEHRKELEKTAVSDLLSQVLLVSYVALTIPYLYRYDLFVFAALIVFHLVGLFVAVIILVIPSTVHIFDFLAFIVTPFAVGINWIIETFKSMGDLFRGNSNIVKLIIKIMLYVAASLLIFILFANLLAVTDAEFKTRIQTVLESLKLTEIMGRTVLGVILSFAAAGYLTLVAYIQTLTLTGTTSEKAKVKWQKAFSVTFFKQSDALLPLVITIPLFLLFALYVWVQSKYLFANNMAAILQQFSFAEYARRGFLELLVVGILTYPVLAWTMNRTKVQEFLPRIATFVVNTGIVGLLGIMLYSLILRMNVYMDSYGPSVLRNYVIIGTIFVGIGLLAYEVLALRKLVQPGFAWIKSILIGDYSIVAVFTAIGLLLVVAFVPWNVVLVGQAQEYFQKTGKVDIFQLMNLPVEAQAAVYNANFSYHSANSLVTPVGVSLLKAQALSVRDTYTESRNRSLFTRVFGFNIAGSLLEQLAGNATTYRNSAVSQINTQVQTIADEYVHDLEQNDFTAVRKLYDPNMVANNIARFVPTTTIKPDVSSYPNTPSFTEDLFGGSMKYVTVSRNIAVTRVSTVQSIVKNELTSVTSSKTTSQSIELTIGFRNGIPVIVSSSLPLMYLPDALQTSSVTYPEETFGQYGYNVYCVPQSAARYFSCSGIAEGFTASDFETTGK